MVAACKRLISRFSRENLFLVLVSVVSVLVVFSPNIQKDIVIGSDSPFHLARIETLALSLSRGEFPVKLHEELCYGFGYGVGFFYSNCFLYIPAVLINLGLSLEIAYKLFAGLIQVCIYLGMFFAVWKLTRNKYAAVIAGVLYQCSIAVLESFYTHFTLGRSTAMVFLPLAIVGIYRIVHENKSEGMLILGFTGLVYSHVLTSVLAVTICALIALIYLGDWVKSREKWTKLLRSVAVVLILTAAFWIPLFEQWTAQTYRASQPWTYVDENVMRVFDLFSASGIGIPLLCLALFLGLWMIGHPQTKTVKVFFFSGVGYLALTTIFPFWHLMRNSLKFLQFPQRLFVIATVVLILAIAAWLAQFHFSLEKWQLIVSVILIVNLYFATDFMSGKVNNLEDFRNRTLHEEIAGLGSGEEWLPLQTTRELLVDPNLAHDDKGNPVEGIHENGKYIFPADGNATYYDVPLVWYKGFAARAGGVDLTIQKNERTGLVRVLMPQGGSGGETVTIWYEGTRLQTAAYLITFCGGAVLAAVVLLARMKRGKKAGVGYRKPKRAGR